MLANGQKAIEASVAKLNSRKASKNPDFDAPAATEETLARLSYASTVDAVAQCDLIVEAIVEDASIKQKFYADLGARAKPEAIFASNTSSLAVAPMAAASKRPDRFVGLHYFNPVQLMKLCEVVQTPEVDDPVVELVDGWARLTGKITVRCKDTPGFIVNRLLVPNLASAIAMAERGDAAIEDIDQAMCLGAGHPMGLCNWPITSDWTRACPSCKGWCAQYPDERGLLRAAVVTRRKFVRASSAASRARAARGRRAGGDGVGGARALNTVRSRPTSRRTRGDACAAAADRLALDDERLLLVPAIVVPGRVDAVAALAAHAQIRATPVPTTTMTIYRTSGDGRPD